MKKIKLPKVSKKETRDPDKVRFARWKKMSKKKRVLITLLAVAVLAGAGYYAHSRAAAADNVASYSTSTLERTDVLHEVKTSGKIESTLSQNITASGEGKIMNQMGGVIATLLAGLLASVNWRASFLVYLMGLISIVLCAAFLPNHSMSAANRPMLIALPHKAERAPRDAKPPMTPAIYTANFILLPGAAASLPPAAALLRSELLPLYPYGSTLFAIP